MCHRKERSKWYFKGGDWGEVGTVTNYILGLKELKVQELSSYTGGKNKMGLG